MNEAVVTKEGRESAIEALLEHGAQQFKEPRQQLNFTLVARPAAEEAVDLIINSLNIITVDKVVDIKGTSFLMSTGVEATFVHTGDRLFVKCGEKRYQEDGG